MFYRDFEEMQSFPNDHLMWKRAIETPLAAWISASTSGGRLKRVPKKIVVGIDYSYSEVIGLDGRPNAELLLPLCEMGLEELHEGFGGEVWLKDRLCYKDGTMFENVFRMEDFLAATKADSLNMTE